METWRTLYWDSIRSRVMLKTIRFSDALLAGMATVLQRGNSNWMTRLTHLAVNNGENHLHGGLKGFDKVVWAGDNYNTPDGAVLNLTYTSKDLEEGYPR